MKPRPLSALHTREDYYVWAVVCYRFQPKVKRDFCLESYGVESDRRDADLMFFAQCTAEHALLRADPAAPQPVFHPVGQMIDIRGWPMWLPLYDIT